MRHGSSDDDAAPWRIFVGVALSAAARADLARRLDGVDLPGRPVAPANWHITLCFLGDVAAAARSRLGQALASSELGATFEARLTGLVALPSPARPRVIAGAFDPDGAAHLAALAGRAAAAVRSSGLALDDRPYVPHVTIARCRRGDDARGALAAAAGRPIGIVVPVDAVVVFRSHLGPGGARYERLVVMGMDGSG